MKLLTEKDKKVLERVKDYLKFHLPSFLMSTYAATFSLIGYIVFELQSVDFQGMDKNVFKALLFGVFVRSVFRMLSDYIEANKGKSQK